VANNATPTTSLTRLDKAEDAATLETPLGCRFHLSYLHLDLC